MTVTPTSSALASLADRLTHTQDRESYSALMCYLNRLPPGDEFRQLAELLGLLSVVGQRVPDALTEFLAEIRAQTKIAVEYQGQVQARLANLPQEIAAGVDPGAIAKDMSESFRQQLSASGLQDTAALLKAAVITLKSLSGEFDTTLKLIAATVSNEAESLLRRARELDELNSRHLERNTTSRWFYQIAVGIAAFALGALYGSIIEKRHTAEVLRSITLRVESIRTLPQSNVDGSTKLKSCQILAEKDLE